MDKEFTIQELAKKLVITEMNNKDGVEWLLNWNKFNDESDIVIKESTAHQLLSLKNTLLIPKVHTQNFDHYPWKKN